MDAPTVELLKTFGLMGATLVIVVLVLRKSVATNSEAIKSNSEMLKSAVESQKTNAETLKLLINSQSLQAQQFAAFQQALERHTQTDADTTREEVAALNAHAAALTANTKTLADVQAALLSQLTGAMTEMRGAQNQIVQAVNDAEGRTGEALTGVQTELTSQHTGQGEALTRAVTEITGEVKTNGAETRKKFEPVMEQLTEIKETLATLGEDMHRLNEQTQSALDQQDVVNAISLKVDALVLAVTKLTEDLAHKPPPEAPPVAPAQPGGAA